MAPNGALQILGRIDPSGQIARFRIELGEIEAVLTKKAQVSAAAVILREDVPGSPRLVAYYVEKADSNASPEALRALLAEDMPEYMIPRHGCGWIYSPLSPNGKLDRAALPVPDATQTAKQEFVAPTTPTEVALTTIFGEVLNWERVGATADFCSSWARTPFSSSRSRQGRNRAGIKITARQLLQHRNAAALAVLADSGGGEAASTATNSALPSLGQFKRNRRAG